MSFEWLLMLVVCQRYFILSLSFPPVSFFCWNGKERQQSNFMLDDTRMIWYGHPTLLPILLIYGILSKLINTLIISHPTYFIYTAILFLLFRPIYLDEGEYVWAAAKRKIKLRIWDWVRLVVIEIYLFILLNFLKRRSGSGWRKQMPCHAIGAEKCVALPCPVTTAVPPNRQHQHPHRHFFGCVEYNIG